MVMSDWEHDGSTNVARSFTKGDKNIRISTSDSADYTVIVIDEKRNRTVLNKGFVKLKDARKFMERYMRSH